jgi:putative DNA primase/helicase
MKPDIGEFKVFVDFLLQNAPADYTPFFLKLQPQSKAPIKGVSWKKSRISAVEAIEWMHRGGNVGIAGMKDDPLVNVDLDGENVNPDELKPTLTVRSRSRTGIHGFYFTKNKGDIPNIPTDDDGEVRCRGQYVVCAGSYVPTDPKTVPELYRGSAGYYTVEDKQPPTWITFSDLPEFFRKQFEKRQQAKTPKPREWNPKKAKGHHSAVFDITAADVVLREVGAKNPSDRWGSIFHDSKTEANMSIKDGLLHCWRHNCSHNGLQALTVLSGYMTCLEAGSPHLGQGSSGIIGDNGAIFHAWLYAKNHGYIPENDPIPLHAMHYIAEKHGLCKPRRGELLPAPIFDKVLRIVREEY